MFIIKCGKVWKLKWFSAQSGDPFPRICLCWCGTVNETLNKDQTNANYWPVNEWNSKQENNVQAKKNVKWNERLISNKMWIIIGAVETITGRTDLWSVLLSIFLDIFCKLLRWLQIDLSPPPRTSKCTSCRCSIFIPFKCVKKALYILVWWRPLKWQVVGVVYLLLILHSSVPLWC